MAANGFVAWRDVRPLEADEVTRRPIQRQLLTARSILRVFVSIGVIAGFMAGTIGAARIVLVQHYLQLGMLRSAAYVLRSEWNGGVLLFAAASALGAGAWLFFRRMRWPARWSFAVVGTTMSGAVVVFVAKGFVTEMVMALAGTDGAGTITAAYVVGKAVEHLSFLIVGALGVLAAALVLAGLFPLVHRLAAGLPSSRAVSKAAVAMLVAVGVVNSVVMWLDLRRPPSGPHVIIVSIDTLRADRLGSYGHGRDTSPHLDALAKDSTVFTDCFAQASWTLTSHISMLSSLYPHAHGVHLDRSLASRTVTLAEILKNEGYTTLGVVRAIGWMDARYGFAQGFDRYYVKPFDEDAGVQNAFLANQLESVDDEKLFLFIHYFDVHSDFDQLPYESPAPIRSRLCGDDPDHRADTPEGTGASEYLARVNREGIPLSPEALDRIRCQYDAGIAYMDSRLAELFELLRRHGLLDSSLLIITSDHGEEFQEHGYMLHSNPFDHRELVHVPLIVREPGGRRSAPVRELVEVIDIMPTVVEYVGAQPPPFQQGMSLVPLLTGNGSWTKPHSLSEARGSVAMTTERWRLLRHDRQGEIEYRLFDRREDPGEMRDVLDLYPDVASELKARMATLVPIGDGSAEGEGRSVELPEETKRMLETLGYLD